MTDAEKIAAKQIALQTAQQSSPKNVLEEAKKIYKWMIEEDKPPQQGSNIVGK